LSLNALSPVVAELGFAIFGTAVFYAGARRFGVWRTTVFFLGSILWTGPLENFAVLRGAYTYYGYVGRLLPNYPGYLMWLGLLPFWIVLGWFVFAMSGFLIFHDVLLTKKRALIQACASALFAVNIDLMMDPVASSNSLWIWLTGSFRIYGVPLFNFIGWFLLIFLYDLIAQHTIFHNKPMIGLSTLERWLFGKQSARQDEEGGEEAYGSIDGKRLIFRIIALETVVIVFLTVLTTFIDYIAATAI
jgi:uncharacterized membrane protein